MFIQIIILHRNNINTSKGFVRKCQKKNLKLHKQVSVNDRLLLFRLTAKVLKEYEIDSLFRTFEERRETQILRSRAQESIIFVY